MSDKQVYELTIDDLDSCGVWFFPMGDTVEDELTVRRAEQKRAQTFRLSFELIFLVKGLCVSRLFVLGHQFSN